MAATFGGIGQAFADRNFRLYSVGSILSWITYFIQAIAFSWTTWELTRSTVWLAIVALIEIGPTVLLLPVGGVMADRVDRFRMVLAAYGCDCLKALALAILAATGKLTLGPVCIAAFLHGVIHSFSVPASYGLMPRFVARERLAAAIAVNAAYTQFAVFAGPAIAGWILVKHGVAAAFATNVAGYLVYFITTAFLVTPEGFVQAKAPRRSVRDDLVEGARYMVGHRGIAALLLLVLVGDAVMSAVYQMMPAYAALLLGTGVGGASALYGAAGIGATLSALWLAHGGAGRATPDRVLWAMLGLSVALLALASAVGLAMALAATLLLGFMSELRRTTTVSILQISIDDSRRGRVMSTQFLVQRLASAAGIALVGASAEVVGLRLPLLAAALVSAAAWLVAARRRTMIRAAFLPAEDPA